MPTASLGRTGPIYGEIVKPPPAVRAGIRRLLSVPNICTIVGATITGLGLGNAADNVVRFNQDRPFTVSLGGVFAGLGLGIILVGRLVARGAMRPRWLLVVVELGSLLAGYAFGGGLDDLLRESQGGPYSFKLGAAFAGLGCGVAAIGWRALKAER